jgi:hypothetical protein
MTRNAHTDTDRAQALTRNDLAITRDATRTDVAWSRTEYNGAQVAGETNDCAVRALMTVTGATYQQAHSLLRTRCGRRHGKGTPYQPLVDLLDGGDVLGARFERVHEAKRVIKRSGWRSRWAWEGRQSLRAFCRANPKGTFYVLKYAHAFAVVDGVLVDTWHVPGGCLATGAWKVTVPATTTAPTHHPMQLKALIMGGMQPADAATACGVSYDRALTAYNQLSDAGLVK